MQCHRQMQSLAANAQAAAAAQAAAVAGLSPQMGGPQRSEYYIDVQCICTAKNHKKLQNCMDIGYALTNMSIFFFCRCRYYGGGWHWSG